MSVSCALPGDADPEDLSGTGWGVVNTVEGHGYRVALGDADAVRTAWMAGAAFLTFTGPLGESVTIKASRVEAVTRWDADACAASNAEDAAQKRRALLEG